MNRPHPLALALVAALLTGVTNAIAQNEDGYPEAHPDDGKVNEDAFAEVRAKTSDEALKACAERTDAAAPGPYNGLSHDEYARMREEQRVYQRQNAAQMVMHAMPHDMPIAEVLARADALYGFIHCGAVGDQPINLASVATEALVAELGARVS